MASAIAQRPVGLEIKLVLNGQRLEVGECAPYSQIQLLPVVHCLHLILVQRREVVESSPTVKSDATTDLTE